MLATYFLVSIQNRDLTRCDDKKRDVRGDFLYRKNSVISNKRDLKRTVTIAGVILGGDHCITPLTTLSLLE